MADSVTLGELISVHHGFAFKGEYFVDYPTQYSLVTPGNFSVDGGFISSFRKFFDGPVPDHLILREGDLVITMTDLSKAGDTLGFGAVVPRVKGITFLHNQRVGRVEILRPDLIDRNFLRWVLRSGPYRAEVLAGATGTTVRHTSPERILRYRLELPPLQVQRAVAAMLGSLDKKMESNRQIALATDALLRAVVKREILLDPHSRTCKFGDLVERVRINVDPVRLKHTVPYIGLEHMPRGSMFLDEWGDSGGLGSDKVQFERGDILFGRLRPYFKKVGVAPLNGICSTDVLVLRPRNSTSLPVALAIAASDPLIGYASAASTGTRMPRVSWEYLAEFKTEIPSPEVMTNMGNSLGPLLSRAVEIIAENRTLAALRDAIQPELLSGRLQPDSREFAKVL